MLSESAIKALTIAYTDEVCLVPDDDPGYGAHPTTIRALVRKGLLEPEDDEDFFCEYGLTDAGRHALGIHGPLLKKPKRLKTAIQRAIIHFLGETPNLGASIFPPHKLNSVVWVNDEQEADYSDALMLVDLHDANLGRVDSYHASAIAVLVRELGFPVFVETNRRFLEFWPDDDA